MSSSLIVGTSNSETPAVAGVFLPQHNSFYFAIMLENYFPVLVFIVVGLAVGVSMVVTGRILGRYNPDDKKCAAYECGFDAFENARIKFDVRYYLVAILFILFDIEIAFLVPWASIVREIAASDSVRVFGFFEMLVFLGVLIVGYLYVRARGGLDWE